MEMITGRIIISADKPTKIIFDLPIEKGRKDYIKPEFLQEKGKKTDDKSGTSNTYEEG